MAARERVRAPRRIRPGTAGDRRPGATVRVAILSTGPEEWAGVDLESGAFVRARPPRDGGAAVGGRWAMFDVARLEVAHDDEPPDPARPEAVALASEPEHAGQLRRGTARRLLAQLATRDQGRRPILGTHGPSTAYVDLDRSAPSVALLSVDPRSIRCSERPDGQVICAFSWAGITITLPLLDARARAAVAARGGELDGSFLAAVAGGRPGYLLVALGAVRRGHAPKVALSVVAKRPARRPRAPRRELRAPRS